ncbi:MAG: sigma-70 family RNA polymerase sigma factor [Candidatus Omnitrophica bacterium]|nr:sigma-70 family RNA polymerase sigma factor [Candidatus Omnitrophota bacterium]MCA9416271.1 sigma-70 family RNA polymerase sigma factor [Candidatus Omnitrophota bacterium]MCA9427023.1 sigma-70 family RNA polymerase sigma factor [Candidatus Omnitrophota bacterium]MCA9444472.1 sigma-70 family RNA polymerase sigma factor [Candidatus Omnitrophota bacterium]MCB9782174.1 sigma-70 family RNA polymerase sigma factor [Candidatus Omnitrophota bacterium]
MEPVDREEELIRRSRKGDLRAYASLVKIHEQRLFHTAYRILHQREDAEDCVQETFVRAWDRFPELHSDHAFRTWIYRILSNQALDMLRMRERRASGLHSLQEETMRLPFKSGPLTPREALRQSRERDRIESAIETLAPKQKIVFVLRHFQGLKMTEISEILDCPVGTVKATLHAALQKLRKALNRPGAVLVERKKNR